MSEAGSAVPTLPVSCFGATDTPRVSGPDTVTPHVGAPDTVTPHVGAPDTVTPPCRCT
ncbi:hypothetical protein K438DRAFT_1971857 [Mycena galopus ATCC 62051]|nr:hypothetical protein K438DRAFT_1971857 [Mycena galopus ATCC 62051]